jgi:hypothetical protein
MDYSYYSINQVPLVTYGMIAITTGVLAFVAMAEDKEGESAPAPAPAPEPEPSSSGGEEEQIGGKRRKKKVSKQKHAKLHKKHTTKRHR